MNTRSLGATLVCIAAVGVSAGVPVPVGNTLAEPRVGHATSTLLRYDDAVPPENRHVAHAVLAVDKRGVPTAANTFVKMICCDNIRHPD